MATGKKFNFRRFNKIDLRVFVVVGLITALFAFGLIPDLYTGKYKNYSKYKSITVMSLRGDK